MDYLAEKNSPDLATGQRPWTGKGFRKAEDLPMMIGDKLEGPAVDFSHE